jgi:hypothetical protein
VSVASRRFLHERSPPFDTYSSYERKVETGILHHIISANTIPTPWPQRICILPTHMPSTLACDLVVFPRHAAVVHPPASVLPSKIISLVKNFQVFKVSVELINPQLALRPLLSHQCSTSCMAMPAFITVASPGWPCMHCPTASQCPKAQETLG